MDLLDHELIDAGDGRRLDRFGTRLVDRPAPGAGSPRRDPGEWGRADVRFTPGGWFAGPGLHSPRIDGPDPWPITMGPLVLELQLGSSGGVGLFPEHALGLPWFAAQAASIAARLATTIDAGDGGLAENTGGPAENTEAGELLRILNLFAHTGLLTLALAADGAAITHLDASRPAVAQARRNADRSGLADRPIRWIVDDAITFTQREARRGRTYHGIVVDPPSYGHAGTRTWQLEDRLAELLEAVARVLDPANGFVLLTAHSTGVGPESLQGALADALNRPARQVECGKLALNARSGATLESGGFARTVIDRGSARRGAER